MVFMVALGTRSEKTSKIFLKKTPFPPPAPGLTCASMDWQELTALLIVAGTAATFAWARWRRRRFSFARDTHCGCASPENAAPGSSVVYRARKGERPQVIVKMK
jgi:hypothetical protein